MIAGEISAFSGDWYDSPAGVRVEAEPTRTQETDADSDAGGGEKGIRSEADFVGFCDQEQVTLREKVAAELKKLKMMTAEPKEGEEETEEATTATSVEPIVEAEPPTVLQDRETEDDGQCEMGREVGTQREEKVPEVPIVENEEQVVDLGSYLQPVQPVELLMSAIHKSLIDRVDKEIEDRKRAAAESAQTSGDKTAVVPAVVQVDVPVPPKSVPEVESESALSKKCNQYPNLVAALENRKPEGETRKEGSLPANLETAVVVYEGRKGHDTRRYSSKFEGSHFRGALSSPKFRVRGNDQYQYQRPWKSPQSWDRRGGGRQGWYDPPKGKEYGRPAYHREPELVPRDPGPGFRREISSPSNSRQSPQVIQIHNHFHTVYQEPSTVSRSSFQHHQRPWESTEGMNYYDQDRRSASLRNPQNQRSSHDDANFQVPIHREPPDIRNHLQKRYKRTSHSGGNRYDKY